MKPIASLLVAIAMLALQSTAACGAETPRPNILIIMADDMGFSDAGCMGSEISTPNLDKLAANGVRFTQFYNTARCCPTRASLLTGLYPHQADMGHMTGWSVDVQGYHNDLSHDAVTIAEVLKPAGYSTYMSGKWHVSRFAGAEKPKDNWPMQRGFSRFYGMIAGGGSYYDPATLTRDNTPISPYADDQYKPAGGRYYLTDAIADQASRFISEHHDQSPDKPFFLYTAFTSPHWPLHALEEDIAKYKGKYDAGYEPIRAARYAKMKELGIVEASWELSEAPQTWDGDVKDKAWEARCMEVYAAQVDRMDQGIGRILAALDKTGQRENTLVMFLQDNGACAEQQGRNASAKEKSAGEPMKPTDLQPKVRPNFARDGKPMRDGVGTMPGPYDTFLSYGRGWANVSNTPFREYKHWVHEGGISTPLIVSWPAGVPAARNGKLESQPGHLIDLMATSVAVSHVTYPEKTEAGHAIIPMQGVSLLPALAGGPLQRKQPIFFEHEGNRAVRDGKYKLVAKGMDGAWELYDIDKDRSEQHDLASSEPDRVKSMSATWQKWAEASNVLPLQSWNKGKRGQDE